MLKNFLILKKIDGIFITMILFLSIIAINAHNANAQECPQGYVPADQTIMVNGCYYRVLFCYKCVQPSAPTADALIWSWTPIDPDCDPGMPLNQVLEYIYSIVLDLNFIQGLPNCSGLKPCDQEKVDFEKAYSVCWRKWRSPNGKVYYVPCEPDGYCFQLWEYCWDPATGTMKSNMYQQYSQWGHEVNCPVMTPLPPDPTIPGTFSECFKLWTPCD